MENRELKKRRSSNFPSHRKFPHRVAWLRVPLLPLPIPHSPFPSSQ